MLANALNGFERGRSYVRSANIDVLTHIYDDDINLAGWQRPVNRNAKAYAEQYLKHNVSDNLQGALDLKTHQRWLTRKLPNHSHKQDFIEDVVEVIEIFAYLFELEEVGFRLTPIQDTMCPRFHVDKVQCRLVTTYAGPGTECLDNHHRIRKQLLSKSFSETEVPTELIQTLNEQEIGLLKGERWNETESFGVIHRSPPASRSAALSANSSQARLLLTLDIIN
ncbi:DUF1826 domain-containing protein [Litoribacillus peritrichatus]|uniref:DUF1826 domain-containing protein n=1 Tax=Litoribacillus peritrichatus TaxID=718191 RepID=A0ABP7MW05_9GAMM